MRRSGAPSMLARKTGAPGKENLVANSTFPSAADSDVLHQITKPYRQKFKSPVAKLPLLQTDNLPAYSSCSLPEQRSPRSQGIAVDKELNVQNNSTSTGRKASQVLELIRRVRPVGGKTGVVLNRGDNGRSPSATLPDLHFHPIPMADESEAGRGDPAAIPDPEQDIYLRDSSLPEVSLTSGLKRNSPDEDENQVVSFDARKKHPLNEKEGAFLLPGRIDLDSIIAFNAGLVKEEIPRVVSTVGNLSREDPLTIEGAKGSDLDRQPTIYQTFMTEGHGEGGVIKHSKISKSRDPLHLSGCHTSSLHGSNMKSVSSHGQQEVPSDYYSVMYCLRKKNAKRKGPWFDGVLICRGRSCTIQDLDGKNISKGMVQGLRNMPEGAALEIGKYDAEIMRSVSKEEIQSGAVYMVDIPSQCATLPPVAQTRKKHPFNSSTSVGPQQPRDKGPIIPLMDTCMLNGGSPTEVPVIVDPYVASKLRPHQMDGVKFMYECVMGLRCKSFCGCLLADEMGLGKTLQVISLIWTLVKQGPTGCPAVKRVLVVCPSSLVQNWGNEVQKWVGRERLRFIAVHAGTANKEAAQRFSDFKAGQVCPVLITSYELLRKHIDKIASAKPGLLVCDEAHRLKNCAGNKTIDALVGLQCPRKILLTGTPVQNDLNEFYAMIDFANPGLLGPLSTFKRIFAEPIELSQDRNASWWGLYLNLSDEEQKTGLARSLELQTRTAFCILRRTADLNKCYLPTKREYLVFCRLQPLQISIYNIITKNALRSLSMCANTSATILSSITSLRKLCSHPQLISRDFVNNTNSQVDSQFHTNSLRSNSTSDYSDIDQLFQASVDQKKDVWTLSGKLSCLYQLLRTVYAGGAAGQRDRVVVVSNFTRTLDVIQNLCRSQVWQWLRLDGSTEVSTRQTLVDQLNSGIGEVFVFLLSSKAGGTGLNLVGANRLVLFDPDWNPATDAQAIARVWREGQLKPVIIYRLLSTGSIEEKIFQRQIMKGGMAAALETHVDGQSKRSGGGRHFTKDELRELFTLNLETRCDTFDLVSRTKTESAKSWMDRSEEIDDPGLKNAVQSGVVSFVSNVEDGLVSVPASISPSDYLNATVDTTVDGQE